MLKKSNSLAFVIIVIVVLSTQVAFAGSKVDNEDCPVFISSQVMGKQVSQFTNGSTTVEGLITGFAATSFPVEVTFKTLTNFFSISRYQATASSMNLMDVTGKNSLCRYEFDMKFDQRGSIQNIIVDWKVKFPTEGLYAINIFIDGTLIGYFPFYVWAR
jgi:hypothetical protein